ncbi:helix-turn-helix domain-containing protein [Cobetia amphilecti]|uniref:helix-turn-helix domain-containing protein n=1 Tax=Cobetia amphilecti TaxID=1055104 RepID=UPI00337BA8F0
MTESKKYELPLADESHYLTEEQAAVLLGLSAHTMRIARHRGTLLDHPTPVWLKLGRKVRYRRADLIEWVERHAVERQSGPVAASAQEGC